MLIDRRPENPNRNKAFIYTTACKLCGKTREYDSIIQEFKNAGYDVVVKQTPLFDGWKKEASKISEKLGIEMPFVWFFNTQKGKTIADAKQYGIDDLLK